MHEQIRNRIKSHRRVRAGELVPHEWNFRGHPDVQKDALAALYREVGFARSLLAYELPDGRLKLIDGHLRRDLDPNMEVDVEVLDVNDEEARKLLLSIDPLASLAETHEQLRARLAEQTPADSLELDVAWRAAAQAAKDALKQRPPDPLPPPSQFFVLVECAGEREQVELLTRFKEQGLTCRALLS